MTRSARRPRVRFRIPNSEFRIHKAVTYREAGVDIEATDRWLSRMQRVIRSTHSGAVLEDRGQFAGLFRLARDHARDPVLVSSTDGVGTKLKLAQLTGRHGSIGVDLVAMNTNDVLAYGAKPLFFLDYIATGRLKPRVLSQVVRGIVQGCQESGCALLGGETAEMPGLYRDGEYDLAGFCVGIADRRQLINGSRVRVGDCVVGLASSGVHANGFSLIRTVFGTQELKRLASQLLIPTRIYVRPVLVAIRRYRVTAIAHVTGGGLLRRIPSLVAKQPRLRARWDPDRWRVPAIFRRIQEAGGVRDEEMFSTFNMGIGMVLTCPASQASGVIRVMARGGIPAWVIGGIEPKKPGGGSTG